MNYSELPRELIFEDRYSLDNFFVDNPQSANGLFFNQMMTIYCLDPMYQETEKQILSIFNDAYYILTLAFLEKRPILRLGYFREIARIWPGSGVNPEREGIVFALINEMLGLFREELNYSLKTFKDKLNDYISRRYQKAVFYFKVEGKVDRYSITDFLPREITKETAEKQDWIKLTNDFNPEDIKQIVSNLGKTPNEKKIVIRSIYDAIFATGNASKLPYSVDKLLNELHQQYDENGLGLPDEAYDEHNESLNIDILMQNNQKQELLNKIEKLEAKIEQLSKSKTALEEKISSIHKEKESAFNAQTGLPCFTSKQMGILMTAVGKITEKENPPGKTTIGDVIEKIAGYKKTTASANMRGKTPPADTDAVFTAIQEKFPNLANEVRKV